MGASSSACRKRLLHYLCICNSICMLCLLLGKYNCILSLSDENDFFFFVSYISLITCYVHSWFFFIVLFLPSSFLIVLYEILNLECHISLTAQGFYMVSEPGQYIENILKWFLKLSQLIPFMKCSTKFLEQVYMETNPPNFRKHGGPQHRELIFFLSFWKFATYINKKYMTRVQIGIVP